MKKIEEDILGWFNLTEYLWFSFGERYSPAGWQRHKAFFVIVKVNSV
jgi:hypothetical protein